MEIPKWMSHEMTLSTQAKYGDRHPRVRLVQEWLALHGFNISIDGIYGPATKFAVKEFQAKNGMAQNGIVDTKVYATLIAPMEKVIVNRIIIPSEYGRTIAQYATAHRLAGAKELLGLNYGPWVRLYMKGNEGPTFAWCAGFVSFVVMQASIEMKVPNALKYTYSCDSLAIQAMNLNRYVRGEKYESQGVKSGDIMLVRRTDDDWIHCGIVIQVQGSVFTTCEGNSNNAFSRNGTLVVQQYRSFQDHYDFVRMGNGLWL